jgi:hypothetical protein
MFFRNNCFNFHAFLPAYSYFVKLNKVDASPLNSTWSKPGQFARLVRQSSGQS